MRSISRSAASASRVMLDALVDYARRPVATWGTPM